MRILAIDPATQLGWAYHPGGTKKAKHGTEAFHNSKWDGAGVRFLKFRQWLQQYHDQVDLIVYEAVEVHSSTYAAHAYGAWIGILQEFAEDHKIPYTGVGVKTIKKFWTGSGSAKKDAMIHEARVRGYNPEDDNAADALAILHYGMEYLS